MFAFLYLELINFDLVGLGKIKKIPCTDKNYLHSVGFEPTHTDV
jgi:hypothetical protein